MAEVSPLVTEILYEERLVTLDRIAALPWQQADRDDLLVLCVAVHDYLESRLGVSSGRIHAGLPTSALRIVADELDRIVRRLRADGLLPPEPS